MTYNEWYLENEHLFDGTGIDADGLREAWFDMEAEGIEDERIYDIFSRIMNAILNC